MKVEQYKNDTIKKIMTIIDTGTYTKESLAYQTTMKTLQKLSYNELSSLWTLMITSNNITNKETLI